MAFAQQFRAQFVVIINFTVENQDRVAVGTVEWLRSALQVDDLQTNRAQRDQARFVDRLLVRTAVDQSCCRTLNDRRVKYAAAVGIARYTAQSFLFSVSAVATLGRLTLNL